MIISYLTGIEFIESYRYELESGQYKVLLFFLGTEYDREFLESVAKFSTDINHLIGQHALAVAFLPPPKDIHTKKLEVLDKAKSFENEEEFAKAMTQSTYEIARHFCITDLPSVVFINPKNMTEVATIKIENSLSDVYKDLRKIFGDWYVTYKEEFDKVKRLKGLYIKTRLGNQRKKKESIYELKSFIREQIIPVINKSLESASEKNQIHPSFVNKLIENLYHQPLSTQGIEHLLTKNKIVLLVEEREVIGSNFRDEYFKLIHRDLNKLLPEFSFERVKRISRKIQVKNLGSSALKGAGKIAEIQKTKLNIFDFLTSIFF